VSQNGRRDGPARVAPNTGLMIDIQDPRLDPLAIANATDCPNGAHTASPTGATERRSAERQICAADPCPSGPDLRRSLTLLEL
jgi:hypothetical protein